MNILPNSYSILGRVEYDGDDDGDDGAGAGAPIPRCHHSNILIAYNGFLKFGMGMRRRWHGTMRCAVVYAVREYVAVSETMVKR